MKRQLRALSSFLLGALTVFGADDYKPGPDSLPQPGIPKGEMLKDKYTATENSVFPGTEREYQIYIPAGLDTSKPAPFMVFQDGVIYQAPVVFDNLIAKKEIPPLIGIFIKPGVVPAANDNALPRFNRSYEYDSVTDSYSRFLIDEFLPAIKARHKLNLSADPNARGIAGSSSGGICAFMVAWHRPDSFRRVFTSVGTYVGIHGADQLPVLVRKFEPKPIRIYLQSGENDNDLYCGDWWMANQMMERSLTWNGYDVNHTWGTGGHNQKHATAIFPDVLRWLWKGFPDEPVKANPRGDAKWRGYEVIGEDQPWVDAMPGFEHTMCDYFTSNKQGAVFFTRYETGGHHLYQLGENGSVKQITKQVFSMEGIAVGADGKILVATFDVQPETGHAYSTIRSVDANGNTSVYFKRPQEFPMVEGIAVSKATGSVYLASRLLIIQRVDSNGRAHLTGKSLSWTTSRLAISPDQSLLYFRSGESTEIGCFQIEADGSLVKGQWYFKLQKPADYSSGRSHGMCVDTNGWLYVATSLGIQVCDQAGRVNFIIPTPQQPHDVCFGGKDLSELFIACGNRIYKRQTKARGYVSGQMAPIKPPPPKL